MSHNPEFFSSEIFRRKPYLRNYFLNSEETASLCDIIPAKTGGEYYVSYNGRAMASQVSPATQARRLVESQKIHSLDVVVILGLGNPHLPFQVNEILRPEQILILLDSEFSLVEKLWETGLSQVLDVPGRHVFCGESNVSLGMNYLESLPIDRLKGIKVLRNAADLQRNPEFFSALEKRIQSLFSAKMSDLLTKFEFERLWVKNSIWNLIHSRESIPRRFCIQEWKDAFVGIPAVLVSAGPTLRENLVHLQKIRSKAFFLSCDTSLKALLKAGIRPDGVVTLDAQTNSFFHFMGESISEIPLFADLVTSPTLLRDKQFVNVIHSVTAKYQIGANGEWIREVTAGGELATSVLGEVGDIQSGGSVATTAFDILRFLGFTEIHFVGQDLAYSGREIHSTGTHHNEKWLTLVDRKKSLEWINETIIRKRETKEVENCEGGMVLTDYVLELYRHWFEESAKSVRNMKLCNWNTLGAKIQGFENVSPLTGLRFLEEKKDHGYPWRNFDPWKANTLSNLANIPRSRKEKANALLQEIQNDLQDLEYKLQIWEKNKEESDAKEVLFSFLEKKSYLKRMIRKTEIYVLRHQQLEEQKKKELLCRGLKKELHYLKKALYPMIEASVSNG